ncbi:M48 family metalloprotease [Desulfogranum japonicum]|uniref:M48 family metalloprotease n=1 Tax=Desulfogranum japonicum TaxID=231447 RepID=UPI0004278896|nr:M48 family metalloprotease [Desulfogranum japonicum]
MNTTELEFSRRQLLTFMAAGTCSALALPLLSGCARDPVTGQSSFVLLSEQQEIQLDRQQSPFQFSTDLGPIQDSGINTYLNRVGQNLAAHSHRPHMPFSFRGVNASYINAYAFPGGSIAATRGILVELDNEAELAALFGHEIGHVCARHSAEHASTGMLSNILVAGAAIATNAAGYSDAASLVQGVGGLGAGALLASYSRDNEREADALGMEYMTRSGYNPSGMVGLMQVLLDNKKHNPNAIELMFATHPMSEERFATARQAEQTKYRHMAQAALHRERYKDSIAALRAQKKMIQQVQEGANLMNQKKFPQAQATLSQALKMAPRDYGALITMAKCCFLQKKIQEAEKYGLQAIRVYPQEAQGHLVTGMSAMMIKQYDKAYHHLQDYDKVLPGNPEITFYKGYSLEQMGKKQAAAENYKKYLQNVNKGKQAQHAHNRLKSWGYIK